MPQYNIKPGRGISGIGAVGSVFLAVFGVAWTAFALWLTHDVPALAVRIIFPAFGILFVILAIAQAWFHYHNATKPNRFTILDIERSAFNGSYCQHCGKQLQKEARFCAGCGRPVEDA